jgi:Fe(3+) dicitrate transport protein
MQDGIPLEMDWIGYPTTYYIPVLQTLESVQMIGAASGLPYGPEPQPVINFISQPPSTRPLAGTTEQVGGSNSLLSSFNKISGTDGDWNYLRQVSGHSIRVGAAAESDRAQCRRQRVTVKPP